MSAGIRADNPLIEFLEGLYSGNRSRDQYESFRPFIEAADPWLVNQAIDDLIKNNSDFDKIEKAVARFIRACAEGLDKQTTLSLDQDHFLSLLQRENDKMTVHRGQLTKLFKELTVSNPHDGKDKERRAELLQELNRISDITAHYRKIEYPLFSAMEDCMDEFHCSKLMWHIHDLIMKGLKSLIQRLENEENPLDKEFNRVFGDVFLKMSTISYREEFILYPVVYRAVTEERFTKMLGELEEFGTSFGVSLPGIMKKSRNNQSSEGTAGSEINLSVGRLLPKQINLMLKNLPLDITFVDENDKVRYYSQGKERIFPRSPGIIGRDVQNCHPPSSVHIVQKIVEDFKARRRDSAEFWIKMGEKFIHIRYFPLFEEDVYKGVIEVSQDIAPLRALEGEKRLLDD
jgi:uncharacterized protein